MSELLVFFKRISHSLIFSQKTSNSNRKPMSPVPGNKEIIQQFFRSEFQMQQTFPGTKELMQGVLSKSYRCSRRFQGPKKSAVSKKELQMQQAFPGTKELMQGVLSKSFRCSRRFKGPQNKYNGVQGPVKYAVGHSRDPSNIQQEIPGTK